MKGAPGETPPYGKLAFTEPSLRVFFEALDLRWIESKIAAKYSENKRRPPLPHIPLVRVHLFKDLRQIKSTESS